MPAGREAEDSRGVAAEIPDPAPGKLIEFRGLGVLVFQKRVLDLCAEQVVANHAIASHHTVTGNEEGTGLFARVVPTALAAPGCPISRATHE